MTNVTVADLVAPLLLAAATTFTDVSPAAPEVSDSENPVAFSDSDASHLPEA